LDELRWILLGLGILAIGAIWLWTARGSRQAPGNAELRAPTVTSGHAPGHAPSVPPPEAPPEPREAAADKREWGVPPLEPLSIRTADFAEVPALDQPILTHADPVDFGLDSSRATGQPRFAPAVELATSEPAPSPPPVPSVSPASNARGSPEHGDRHAAVAPPAPNNSEKQKIVTVRVCAVGEARWAGTDLMSALEALGLAYGRYQVYHRNHSDGRSIFCVASLVEPGTFDLSTMAGGQFRGVSLFAVLPGPLEPMQAVDALLATARELARALCGTMQDAKGIPFSPQRAEALLQDVARFQALLA
jgi:cell division protein ZipA